MILWEKAFYGTKKYYKHKLSTAAVLFSTDKNLYIVIASNSSKFKITAHKKNIRKNAKSAKINVCLKECCIVSGVGMTYYQPQQFLSCVMIPGSFWCNGILCK